MQSDDSFDFNVNLNNFNGSLEILLDLAKSQKVDCGLLPGRLRRESAQPQGSSASPVHRLRLCCLMIISSFYVCGLL